MGGEIQKERPAVIVSNDAANRTLNRVQVVPISSNVNRRYPGEARVTLYGQSRKAMADQLTTVSKERLSNERGILSLADMEQVDRAIATQLGLR
ncbi:MAG TPA: type II toxin-antitoxin system PemK/MazF family toxin [Chthonomonadaceae bacterium]|nr:type II toxin-antitoxin system PemK/MazF family toxin [Chthonomonadaceae bacterium]